MHERPCRTQDRLEARLVSHTRVKIAEFSGGLWCQVEDVNLLGGIFSETSERAQSHPTRNRNAQFVAHAPQVMKDLCPLQILFKMRGICSFVQGIVILSGSVRKNFFFSNQETSQTHRGSMAQSFIGAGES